MPLLSPKEDSSLEGDFSRHYFQNLFSCQNNPPIFPKDSASCSCVSPLKAVEVFQLFGLNILISASSYQGVLSCSQSNP